MEHTPLERESIGDKSDDHVDADNLWYFNAGDTIDYFDGSNSDKYYFPDESDPDGLDELVEDPEVEYDDDTLFYHDGVYIDSPTTLQLMSIFSGKYGLFQRQGHVNAADHGHPKVVATEAARSLEISKQQIQQTTAILYPVLLGQGVPEAELPSKVDRIIASFKEKYSGTKAKRDQLKIDRNYHFKNANDSLKRQRTLGDRATQLSIASF